MIDRCGRNIDYLRISVTDRCNLRCIYCMPEEGVQHVERSLILQEEEILRICRVMAELGIRKIKLTGGEPLVRPRMPQSVSYTHLDVYKRQRRSFLMRSDFS